MPIFMDRHIIPGVTAKDAAEAHRMDLQIEEEYHCRCMTYWVDEERGSAFCLIDAPSKEAVIALHREAHGLIPHAIVEVNSQAVKSFLGRIEDPDETDLIAHAKLFNEPVVRTVLMVQHTDPLLLQLQLGKEKANNLLSKAQNLIKDLVSLGQGSAVEYPTENQIYSFRSAQKAVQTAVKLSDHIQNSDYQDLGLRMCLNSGVPVTHGDQLFGDTVRLASRILKLSSQPLLVTSMVNDLYKVNRQNHKLTLMHQKQEEFVETLMDLLEQHYPDASLDVNFFSKSMSLSKSAYYRKLQALTGKSPNQILKEYRLNRSLVLLKKRNRNVSETSFDCGFTSPSYFTKCFHQYFHLTPNELLKAISQ